MNSSLLKAAPLSLDVPEAVAERVYWTRDVDKRDGFPIELRDATLLVIASPIQTLGKRCEQRGVELPAEEILQRRGLSRYYRLLPGDFRLERGVRAFVYERQAEIPSGELERLKREIAAPCP